MVFAIVRLLGMGFVVMTVMYIVVSLYSSSVRREKLERQWDEAGQPGDRATYVAEGMDQYRSSLRRKLIWGVYVIPTILLIGMIYLTNFY